MQLTEEEKKLSDEAVKYVKNNKTQIIGMYTNDRPITNHPISIFMAGSPGAGKTEVSKELVKEFDRKPMRIDADELRALCPGYIGTNAHLYQKAANKAVNILYDYALKQQKCHIILDGTFAYSGAIENIQRSLDKKRKVEIWFIHQDPLLAWEFTKAREKIETRRVRKDIFIYGFLNARENISLIKAEFQDDVIVNLLVKNTDNTNGKLYMNIKPCELDVLAGGHYTEDDLNKLLS